MVEEAQSYLKDSNGIKPSNSTKQIKAYHISQGITKETILIFSLSKFNKNSLDKALPFFHKDSANRNYFSYEKTDKQSQYSRNTTLAICDKVKSLEDVDKFLNNFFDKNKL